MPLPSGKANVGPNIAELESTGRPHRQAVAIALDIARRARAEGGRVHVGPIHSSVAGRTDHLPMEVPEGAYVIPADVVSHHGEGNTLAGFRVLRTIFDIRDRTAGHPYGAQGLPYGVSRPHRASGGTVPIIAAGGEMVVPPDAIQRLADRHGGTIDDWHKVLDAFVTRSRSEAIKTLRKLPGPKKN